MKIIPPLFSVWKWSFFFVLMFVSSQVTAQRTLGLDKKGKVKRVHFYEGQSIKIKLVTNEKVSGHLNGIFDSSFVIDGRKIKMAEVSTVYSTRKTMRFIGGALMVSGAFYFALDAVNNLFNYSARNYVFSNSVWLPSAVAVGSGAILYYFSIKRTPVLGQNNFKIYNTSPIPIAKENRDSDSLCENSVTAILKPIKLDGCTWILELPTGEQLEPVNYTDYITEDELEEQMPVPVRVVFNDTKTMSICMVGRTVAISCVERLK